MSGIQNSKTESTPQWPSNGPKVKSSKHEAHFSQGRTNFPFPPVHQNQFTVNDLEQYYNEVMSFGPTFVRPSGSSTMTSPAASTPGDPYLTGTPYDWSSSSESNSPGSSYRYGPRYPYEQVQTPYYEYPVESDYQPQNHVGGFYATGAALPEAPPTDIFTPSLVRRPPMSQTHSQKVKYSFCVFCKNNGEDEAFYLGHTLKDDNGRVTCPILFNYRCPICGASGPVSHTIRYCPHNKGQLYEEQAHITVLKQMRSSTGKKAAPPPGVVGGPIFANVPPSKRPPGPNFGPLAPGSKPNLGLSKSHSGSGSMRGPNAAWSGMTNQPCTLMPMVGELLNQEDRDRKDREKAAFAAQNELLDFARNFGLSG